MERYKILFETSSDAIMTVEPPEWRFTSANPATIKIFRAKDEKDFISRSPWELSPERQPDGELSSVKAKEMMGMAVKNGSNLFEWTHKRITGEEFPATVLLSRISQGGKVYLQATVRDISELKKMEDELKKRIESLERFQKVAVDRELKMKELKQEIARLKEGLPKR